MGRIQGGKGNNVLLLVTEKLSADCGMRNMQILEFGFRNAETLHFGIWNLDLGRI